MGSRPRAAPASLRCGALVYRADRARATGMIQVFPLAAIPEIAPHEDLAAVLADATGAAGLRPEAADVLVVTQKIVSKAEDRFVDLAGVTPGPRALELAEVTGKDPRLVELVLA